MSDRRIRRRYSTTTAVISPSTGTSSEFNTVGLPLQGVILPATWTSASLTFLAADIEGGTFADIYDGAGTEINVEAAASRAIGFTTSDQDALSSFQYLKIRSGTAAAPVTQSAERTIIAILRS